MSNVEMVIEFKWNDGDDPFGRVRGKKEVREQGFLRTAKAAADTPLLLGAYREECGPDIAMGPLWGDSDGGDRI